MNDDLIALDVPCPACRNNVPVQQIRMGTYVLCEQCGMTFLVIDEASLPTSGTVQFQPQVIGETNARTRIGFATGLREIDDPTGKLATWSLFFGGVSLALICAAPLGIVTSVPGLVFGLMSLKGSLGTHAMTGVVINSIAISINALLGIAALQ